MFHRREYKRRIDTDHGYYSECEIDGEIFKLDSKIHAKGNYSEVRKLNKFVVINSKQPTTPDAQREIKAKVNFFKRNYPNSQVEYFSFENDYRLVLPAIPGVPYFKLNRTLALNKDAQLKLMLSAINALDECYKKTGLILLDLNQSNLLYDFSTGHTHLIDGGWSVTEGNPIDERFWDDRRSKSLKIAPECRLKQNMAAEQSMDVYSLALALNNLFNSIDFLGLPQEFEYDEGIKAILKKCLNDDPKKRPGLNELREFCLSQLPLDKQNKKIIHSDIRPQNALPSDLEEATLALQSDKQDLISLQLHSFYSVGNSSVLQLEHPSTFWLDVLACPQLKIAAFILAAAGVVALTAGFLGVGGVIALGSTALLVLLISGSWSLGLGISLGAGCSFFSPTKGQDKPESLGTGQNYRDNSNF